MMLTEKELLALAEVSETGINEFEYHVFSDEHLDEFARAIIAANNKKVLADLKPVGYADGGHIFYHTAPHHGSYKAVYGIDIVAALIQERDDYERRWQAERRTVESSITGGRYPDGYPAY